MCIRDRLYRGLKALNQFRKGNIDEAYRLLRLDSSKIDCLEEYHTKFEYHDKYEGDKDNAVSFIKEISVYMPKLRDFESKYHYMLKPSESPMLRSLIRNMEA